jgi:hypothetical protein
LQASWQVAEIWTLEKRRIFGFPEMPTTALTRLEPDTVGLAGMPRVPGVKSFRPRLGGAFTSGAPVPIVNQMRAILVM